MEAGEFTHKVSNPDFRRGPERGKTHISTALSSLGTSLIKIGNRVRFFNIVDLINILMRQEQHGKTGRLHFIVFNYSSSSSSSKSVTVTVPLHMGSRPSPATTTEVSPT